MNDIYLNEDWENYLSWDKEPPKNKWTPIGNEKSPFTASFNGNGHTIYGLYIDTKEVIVLLNSLLVLSSL